MVRGFFREIRQLLKWGKVLLPINAIKYYPPQFVIRDPVIGGVKKAFNQGYEVAVLAFNVKDIRNLIEQLGEDTYRVFIKKFKKFFRESAKEVMKDTEIILIHDYYSDGLTLFLKVAHDRQCVSEIDVIVKNLLENTNKKLLADFPSVRVEFEAGYMFIEKKHYSVREAILKAHQQAVAMAEKKVQTEFNQMLYSVSKLVSQKNITLLAQPIIDVTTKQIQAWEMLTRGPKGSPLESPLQLFSVARQTSMLYDLEIIVLEKTLEQINQTGCVQNIFINFTPITLGSQRFLKDVKKLMSTYKDIPASQLTIEITERDSFEGLEHLISNIRELRRLGFRIAIDDTGSGYASLNAISEIMPDIIKIDRAVIQDIDKSSVKESVLRGLILVAKETGSLIVAEGIENEEEVNVLSRHQVDMAQGYFFARPDSLLKGLAAL